MTKSLFLGKPAYDLEASPLSGLIPRKEPRLKREYFTLVVELYCSCSTDIAASRFRKRERHPGHLDRQKSQESMLAWMADYREGLPLRVGSLVVAETDDSPLLDDIIYKVRRNISVNK